MEFQWDSCGISKGFHLIPMVFLEESVGISMIFLLGFYDISLGLLSNFIRASMGMKQDFYDLFMVFPWDSCGLSVGFS